MKVGNSKIVQWVFFYGEAQELYAGCRNRLSFVFSFSDIDEAQERLQEAPGLQKRHQHQHPAPPGGVGSRLDAGLHALPVSQR